MLRCLGILFLVTICVTHNGRGGYYSSSSRSSGCQRSSGYQRSQPSNYGQRDTGPRYEDIARSAFSLLEKAINSFSRTEKETPKVEHKTYVTVIRHPPQEDEYPDFYDYPQQKPLYPVQHKPNYDHRLPEHDKPHYEKPYYEKPKYEKTYPKQPNEYEKPTFDKTFPNEDKPYFDKPQHENPYYENPNRYEKPNYKKNKPYHDDDPSEEENEPPREDPILFPQQEPGPISDDYYNYDYPNDFGGFQP